MFRQAGDAVPSSQPAPDDWATGAQPLASDALRATALDNQLAKLSQDNGYTVLLHKAWRQDIGETPVKIALSEGQEQDHHFPVEGTLTLSQVRFVDMEADFWVNRFGDDGFLAGSQHIRQGTRLKNGELTYLDHPSLGILIRWCRSAPVPPPQSHGNGRTAGTGGRASRRRRFRRRTSCAIAKRPQ